MNHKLLVFLTILLVSASPVLQAQSTITIGISKDANSIEFNEFNKYLKKEIVALTKSRFKVNFKELGANWQQAKIRQNNQKLMADPDVSLLVTLGYIVSN